jgi:hypothetical protein
MSKQLYSQRFILKIHSSRLKLSRWSLDINLKEARDNEELISLGDSQLLRFIREIKGINYSEKDIKEVKKQIKLLKKDKNSKKNREEIKKLYDKLDDMLYIKDYVAIVFEKKSDFDRATGKKGCFINGKKYKRLIGTTGGVKQNTVMFCSEEIHKELNDRLENGRNKEVPIIPAKFEAYKSLSASVSNPVTQTDKVLVIKDGTTHIKDNVIRVYDDGKGGFKVDHDVEYEADKDFTDGAGMIRPSFMEQWAIDLGLTKEDENGNIVADYIPSGVNSRWSYEKGMLVTYDFELFAKEIAGTYEVYDVWGQKHDIRNIDIILTTNMLKLWNAYDSIEDYLNKCKENKFELCVTKVTPKELEIKRNLNYQYLQSYKLSDNDIKELTCETVKNIKDVIDGDYIKSILFAKGIHITQNNILKSDYDFIRALTIDERLLEDSYVKKRLYKMIEKTIKDAKKGVIQTNGSYSIIVGDMYALCQSMFGLPITGLLNKGEFYSRTWSDRGKDEIVGFRSPMTSHNNIRKHKLKDNDKLRKWFKYINTMTVFNAWDTTTDAMNGADYDSDAEIEIDNDVITRNTRDELTIICEQKSASKVKVTESLLKKSNKNGFGDDIGTITNRVTAMFDVLASLQEGTKEYEELMDRIIQGQAYQQESIDKIKGIQAKQMPKHWFDYRSNKIESEDSQEIRKEKEKNIKLMVNKKPYFFIYNYDNLFNKYRTFMKNVKNNALIKFGLTLDELKEKENKTEDEIKFLNSIQYKSPVFTNPCTMNKICWKIEEEFKDIKLKVNNTDKFDKEILKSNEKYDKHTYEEIEKLYKEYIRQQKQFGQTSRYKLTKEEKHNQRQLFIDNFKIKAEEICPNQECLCNIVIDITYKSKNNRQFAWDICGEQIIENLLNKNNRKYKYPVQDENGDIEWQGLKFKMVELEDKKCEE